MYRLFCQNVRLKYYNIADKVFDYNYLGAHTFCKKCLDKVYKSNSVNCPKCRISISTKLDKLLINWALADVIDINKIKLDTGGNKVVVVNTITPHSSKSCADTLSYAATSSSVATSSKIKNM